LFWNRRIRNIDRDISVHMEGQTKDTRITNQCTWSDWRI